MWFVLQTINRAVLEQSKAREQVAVVKCKNEAIHFSYIVKLKALDQRKDRHTCMRM